MTGDRQKLFEQLYQSGIAPWDTDWPHPALVALVEAGTIHGPVLDVGCGSGANAAFLAAAGLEVLGVDFAATAIDRARQRTQSRALRVRWVLGDVWDIQPPTGGFASALDIGTLQTLPQSERQGYVDHINDLLAIGGCAHLMCFSESAPPKYGDRFSRARLQQLFFRNWRINCISPTYFIGRQTGVNQGAIFESPAAWHLQATKIP